MSIQNTRIIQTRLASSKVVAPMLVIISLASAPLTAWSQNEANTVKMSESGICHDVSSQHYERVKSFKPYASIQECLDAGGRKPKK